MMIDLRGLKLKREGNKLIFLEGEPDREPVFTIGETFDSGGGLYRVIDYGPSMIRIEKVEDPKEEVKTYLA